MTQSADPLTLVQFSFGGLIDEAVRPELVDPSTSFPVIENVRQPQRGVAEKRFAFTALTNTVIDGTTRTGGGALFFDSEAPNVVAPDLANGNGYFLETFSETLGENVKLGGRAPDCDVVLHPVPAPGQSNSFESIVYVNGYIAACWTVGNNTWAALFDAADWSTIVPPRRLGNATTPDCAMATYGNLAFAVIADSGGPVLYYYLDTTSASSINTGWVGSAAVSAGNTYVASLAVDSLSDRIVVAWADSRTKTVGTAVIIALTATRGTVSTSSANPTSVDIAATAGTLYVGYDDGTAVKVAGLDPTALTVTDTAATVVTVSTAATMVTVVPPLASGTGFLVVNDSAGIPLKAWLGSFTVGGGAVTGTGSNPVYNAAVCSRAIGINGRVYAAFYSGDYAGSVPAIQQQVVLCDLTGGGSLLPIRPVACPTFNLSVPSKSFSTALGYTGPKPPLAALPNNVYAMPLGVKRSGVANASVIVAFDFGSAQRWKTVRHNGQTFITGGCSSYTDGDSLREVGFLFRPPKAVVTKTTGSISLTNGRVYVSTYEEVDASGTWCVSGISDPSLIGGSTTTQSYNVAIPPLTITGRIQTAPTTPINGVVVAVYATLDVNNGNPPFYRVGTILNGTNAATVNFNDNMTDAVLATQPQLYSADLPSSVGSSLDRRAPPGLKFLCSYNGMLVGALGSTLFASGQPVPGEATWFSPIFQTPVPSDDDITGLIAMDGTLFVFKLRSIWSVAGDIPTDNGGSGGLGTPSVVASDSGNIEGRALVLTSAGIFYQSSRGIELLQRGGAGTVWVGEQIRQTFAAFPVIVAATLDFTSERVMFELTNVGASAGRCAVYNLNLGGWESIDRRTSVSGTTDYPAVSAAMINLGGSIGWTYAFLDAAGTIYYQDTTTYLDGGSHFVVKHVRTGSVKVGGVQGKQMLQRGLLLAKLETPHDMDLTFAYDYGARASTSTRVSTGLITLAGELANMQLYQLPDDNARCQAVALDITDAAPSGGESVGTGQGSAWVAVTFEITRDRGAYQLPDASG